MSGNEQEGQCKAYSECENDPGPDGLCGVHRDEYYRAHPDEAPVGRRCTLNPAGMTIAGYNAFARREGLEEICLDWDSNVVSGKEILKANKNREERLGNQGH